MEAEKTNLTCIEYSTSPPTPSTIKNYNKTNRKQVYRENLLFDKKKYEINIVSIPVVSLLRFHQFIPLQRKSSGRDRALETFWDIGHSDVQHSIQFNFLFNNFIIELFYCIHTGNHLIIF